MSSASLTNAFHLNAHEANTGPVFVMKVVATQDFNSPAKDQLSFSKGEEIGVIVHRPGRKWWFAQIGDLKGWIPSTHVQCLPPSAPGSTRGNAASAPPPPSAPVSLESAGPLRPAALATALSNLKNPPPPVGDLKEDDEPQQPEEDEPQPEAEEEELEADPQQDNSDETDDDDVPPPPPLPPGDEEKVGSTKSHAQTHAQGEAQPAPSSEATANANIPAIPGKVDIAGHGFQSFKAVAVARFGAQNKDQLSFEKGDIMNILIRRVDHKWWFAELGDLKGWIPAAFVVPVLERVPGNSPPGASATPIGGTSPTAIKPMSSPPAKSIISAAGPEEAKSLLTQSLAQLDSPPKETGPDLKSSLQAVSPQPRQKTRKKEGSVTFKDIDLSKSKASENVHARNAPIGQVKANFSYTAISMNQLSFEKGDTLDIIVARPTSHWIYARFPNNPSKKRLDPKEVRR
eukprot:TRINITY_DN13362_c0_g1_i3.p1 TRINITY_DN13362_c0_g1~~TRINITY_DN13362_c0_g1_i3.p1  ORF type:complete len:458 (+),score=120.98 TRINITY_DN13362_c0_g1_i3:2-1375(+)